MASVTLILLPEKAPFEKLEIKLTDSEYNLILSRRDSQSVSHFLAKNNYGHLEKLINYTNFNELLCVESDFGHVENPLLPDLVHAEGEEMAVAAAFCRIFKSLELFRKIYIAVYDENCKDTDLFYYERMPSYEFISNIIRRKIYARGSVFINSVSEETAIHNVSSGQTLYEINVHFI